MCESERLVDLSQISVLRVVFQHCGKPICCPTSQAPKQCTWRGDNNGQGSSSDCSAQCAPGEINIKGIGSSWGGGFLNDGNTNKCARGFKVFCCPDPAFLQLTQGCSYTKWCVHASVTMESLRPFFNINIVGVPVQVDKQRSSLVPRGAGSENKRIVVRTQRT